MRWRGWCRECPPPGPPAPRAPLTIERYDAILATLAERGHLRGVEPLRDPGFWEFVDPLAFYGPPRPWIEPDGYFDLPHRVAA